MPDVICKNKKCSQYNKVMTEPKMTMKIVGTEVICPEQVCPFCGSKREDYKKDGYCTTFLGSDNICKK